MITLFCIGTQFSAVTPLSVGVSQGSGLGPLVFSIYTSPTAPIADQFGIQQQQYIDIDNTQLYF